MGNGSSASLRSRFANFLIEQIELYSKQILSILNNQELELASVIEVLHDEKIINILVTILSKPDELEFYEDIENIVADFEHDPLEVENYTQEIAYFTCEFTWLLTDMVYWKGDEKFCRNIYGKKI